MVAFQDPSSGQEWNSLWTLLVRLMAGRRPSRIVRVAIDAWDSEHSDIAQVGAKMLRQLRAEPYGGDLQIPTATFERMAKAIVQTGFVSHVGVRRIVDRAQNATEFDLRTIPFPSVPSELDGKCVAAVLRQHFLARVTTEAATFERAIIKPAHRVIQCRDALQRLKDPAVGRIQRLIDSWRSGGNPVRDCDLAVDYVKALLAAGVRRGLAEDWVSTAIGDAQERAWRLAIRVSDNRPLLPSAYIAVWCVTELRFDILKSLVNRMIPCATA